jgi:hypothetical protein
LARDDDEREAKSVGISKVRRKGGDGAVSVVLEDGGVRTRDVVGGVAIEQRGISIHREE